MQVTSRPISSGRIPLAFGASDTTKTFSLKGLRGTLQTILYEQYDTTNDVTGTVAITDENSKTLFSKASLTDATATLIQVLTDEAKIVAFEGRNKTLTVTLNGAPGNAGTVYVTLMLS